MVAREVAVSGGAQVLAESLATAGPGQGMVSVVGSKAVVSKGVAHVREPRDPGNVRSVVSRITRTVWPIHAAEISSDGSFVLMTVSGQ